MLAKAKVLKAGAEYEAFQGPDYQPGVSAETSGAVDLWLGVVTIPPGKRTKAHVHERHESAFYMSSLPRFPSAARRSRGICVC